MLRENRSDNRAQDRGNDNEALHSQILSSELESQHKLSNFHTLQAHNKALLTSCTDIQKRMGENRENRLQAKRQLSKIYRLLMQRPLVEKATDTYPAQLQSIRDQISDLEKEHVLLHQQFINLQSQFRQTVKNQRRHLMETVNRTRARASIVRSENMFISNMPVGESANSDSSTDYGPTDIGDNLRLRA